MIAIVGGGLVGLACAWELVERGEEVTIIDRGPVSSEARQSASWAGAGMLAPDSESFSSALWKQRARDAAMTYAAWIEKLGGDVDFHAPREEHGRIIDGHVDPRDLLRELRCRLEGRAAFVEHSVERLEQVQADSVVVAAGSWSSAISYRGVPLPATIPVRGYMLAWEGVPAGSVPEVLHEGSTYVLQRRRGLVLAGSTEERIGFAADIDWTKLRDLRQRAQRLFPALENREPDQFWWGFRPGTPDGMPYVRHLDSRVFLAYGHYRNGILLAPWTAQWVAGEITASRGKSPAVAL